MVESGLGRGKYYFQYIHEGNRGDYASLKKQESGAELHRDSDQMKGNKMHMGYDVRLVPQYNDVVGNSPV